MMVGYDFVENCLIVFKIELDLNVINLKIIVWFMILCILLNIFDVN